MQHDATVCRDYFKTGNCQRGDRCRFRHVNSDTQDGKCTYSPSRDQKQPINSRTLGDRPGKARLRPRRRDGADPDATGVELVRGRNTESFTPSYRRVNLTVQLSLDRDKCSLPYRSNEVILAPNIFDSECDYFTKLVSEIDASGISSDRLWKMWHGDTHLIVDDKLDWKCACPTFNSVINRLRDYFGVDIQATRFNLYRSGEWKPYHHDAAAVDGDKARRQNITIAASFGATREIAFQYAKTRDGIEDRATVSFPLPNGSVYTFGNQVNLDWRHGVPPQGFGESRGAMGGKQLHCETLRGQGPPSRVSIIIWGWVDPVNNK